MRYYTMIFSILFLFPFFVSAQSFIFSKNLYFGMRGDSDVTKLQEFLTEQGVYSGPITGNFFSLTLKAVKDFQRREGIFPIAGYFGPLTRARTNSILSSQVPVFGQQIVPAIGSVLQQQQPSNSILCNGKYWAPCKQGQPFDCPESGEARCIVPNTQQNIQQSTLKLSEPDKTLLQDFNDLLRKETQRLKQEKEYARQQELARLNCLLAPSPENERMLSPQQQNYLREKRCGTSTPASDLNYKLYQQQEYQKCLIEQLTSPLRLSCEYLKPIFY